MLKEFKEFLLKGNAVDMAVGFMFGAAFASIIKSLVDNIIMPPIGMLMGGIDFSNSFIALDGKEYATLAELEKAGAPAIKYGSFINDSLSFLILGFVIFMMVRTINKLQKPQEEAPTTKKCPTCAMEIPIEAHKCGYCAHQF
jgi:large conductance mechanosensitive channel